MNSVPLFYCHDLPDHAGTVSLDAETRKHVMTVLRMSVGEVISLTNGKGRQCTAVIASSDKKNLAASITECIQFRAPARRIVLACSLLKNASRFEWMVEKVTEIGVTEIVPLLCQRTTRQHFRMERVQQIVQSAALQSQNLWFPQVHAPMGVDELFATIPPSHRYIAHCMEGDKKRLDPVDGDVLLLIGPEGDFTAQELSTAEVAGAVPVSLGESRLRTETAAIVGAAQLFH